MLCTDHTTNHGQAVPVTTRSTMNSYAAVVVVTAYMPHAQPRGAPKSYLRKHPKHVYSTQSCSTEQELYDRRQVRIICQSADMRLFLPVSLFRFRPSYKVASNSIRHYLECEYGAWERVNTSAPTHPGYKASDPSPATHTHTHTHIVIHMRAGHKRARVPIVL